jgi:hypothetical protein
MGSRGHYKREEEKTAATQLFCVLGLQAQFLGFGDPNLCEPDVLFILEGRKIGIEVATAWPTDSDARDHVTLEAGEREFSECGFEMRSGGTLDAPKRRSCERIQREVRDKCKKNYKGADEFWLCIRLRSPYLSMTRDIAECLREVVVPSGHCFARLYLLYRPDHSEGDGLRSVAVS